MSKFAVYKFTCYCENHEDFDVTILAYDEDTARDELASYIFGEGLSDFIMKVSLTAIVAFEGLVAI